MTQNLSTVLYRAVQKGEVVRHYVNDNLWYHSHPGFSYCLEDLPDYLQKDDLFIKRNISFLSSLMIRRFQGYLMTYFICLLKIVPKRNLPLA